MAAYTLDSRAAEVISGCRAVVIENGDGLDGCRWAEKGLEACGDLTFREVIDLGGDMAMMVCQVLVLPYLERLFDREALDCIARACAKHPKAAAWLLHLRGEGLPDDARAEAEANVSESALAGLALCPDLDRYRRPFT